MKAKKILMVAGEVSGDLQGAHLMAAIQRLDPEVRFFGMGGEALAKQGMRLLFHAHSVAVVGITEVLFKLRSVAKALRGLKQALDRERPDLVILVDFPDFNLRLAKAAHHRSIPILYYISPQVWAWRPGRVKRMARYVRKMLVFFRFEVPLYEEAGVDVTWVGHPLLDMVKPSFSKDVAAERFGLDPRGRTVGLLPGSRRSEVGRLLAPLVEAAHLLQKEIPGLQFVIPLAPGIPKSMLSPWTDDPSIPLKVVEGHPHEVMNACELLITASGTATLEGAILGKPMVIVYRVSPLSYWIGRALIRVNHIGMVNLVAEREVAPELIQKDATPRRISEEAFRILKDPVLARRMTEAMEEVRHRLGRPGAARRAAEIACGLLNEARGSSIVAG